MNHQLTGGPTCARRRRTDPTLRSAGAADGKRTTTASAPCYRLLSLATEPPKPVAADEGPCRGVGGASGRGPGRHRRRRAAAAPRRRRSVGGGVADRTIAGELRDDCWRCGTAARSVRILAGVLDDAVVSVECLGTVELADGTGAAVPTVTSDFTCSSTAAGPVDGQITGAVDIERGGARRRRRWGTLPDEGVAHLRSMDTDARLTLRRRARRSGPSTALRTDRAGPPARRACRPRRCAPPP